MPKSSLLMRRLRAILLTDYIGAILIALLATQAIIFFLPRWCSKFPTTHTSRSIA